MDSRTDMYRAYDKIVELVANGELRPGERTSVIALAERLNIGRSPVKEAITRLRTEGLLVVKGRSGTSVSDFGEEKVRQLFGIRRLLEGYAAEQAVSLATPEDITRLAAALKSMRRATKLGQAGLTEFINADVAFHTAFIKSAKNAVLETLYSSIKMHLQIVIYLHYGGRRKSAARIEEHEAILEMLEKRNLKGLQKVLRDHSSGVEQAIVDVVTRGRARVGGSTQGVTTSVLSGSTDMSV